VTDLPPTADRRPGFRSATPDLVPRLLLLGMVVLALAALALSAFAVLTDRPNVGQPEAAAVIKERLIVLEGHGATAVTVRNPDGSVLLDLPEGGFVAVIENGLSTERRKHGIDPLKPVRLVRYANGRLAAEDPETGWSAELYAFGSDNKAAFERLLDMK
jgi:putative photosynthetic complex assembly protein